MGKGIGLWYETQKLDKISVHKGKKWQFFG